MLLKKEYIWPINISGFLIIFGAFLYTMGLTIAGGGNGLGIYSMFIGIVIALFVVAISFLFYKQKYITAVTSICCFVFAGWHLNHYRFLDTMEKTQQEINTFGAGDIPMLRLLNTITIIIFVLIGVIEAIFSIYIYKRYGKEWRNKLTNQKNEMDEIKFNIAPSKFKYCPKCLYQAKIELGEKTCPKCNEELKLPELTPNYG